MSTLTFTAQAPGNYVAELDGSTGVLRWVVARTADRRWAIVSIRDNLERRRHGAAYTLREAKEAVENFHRSNLALARHAAREARTVPEALDAARTGEEFGNVLSGLFASLEAARDTQEENERHGNV